jgi:hypothetical protein
MNITGRGKGRNLEGRVAFISGVAKTNSIGFATAEVFGEKELVVIDGGNTIQEYKGPSEFYY